MTRLSFFLCVALACRLMGASLQAQEILALKPPLSQVFPLDPHPEGMRVLFPVMLNINTIVKPDALLRFLYIDPDIGAKFKAPGMEPGNGGPGNGGSGGKGHGHHHSSDNSSNVDGTKSDDSTSAPPHDDITQRMSKEEKAEIQTEVWLRVGPFRDAFDQALDDGTNLVYLLPGRTKPVISPLDFPEGLFLGERGGHVLVLAVLEKSPASEAGVLAGDEVQSINGKLLIHSLHDFAHGYLSTKRSMDETHQNAFSLELIRAGQPVSVQIAQPNFSNADLSNVQNFNRR